MSSRFKALMICSLSVLACVQCAAKHDLKSENTSATMGEERASPNALSYYYFILGELAQLDSDSAQALEHFRWAARFDQDSYLLKRKQAEQLLMMGKIQAANSLVAEMSAEDSSEDPEYYLLKARISAFELNMDQSADYLDRAVELYAAQGDFRKYRETLLMKVALLSDARMFDRALSTLNKYLKENEDDEIAYYFVGKISSVTQKKNEAIAAFQRAVDINPNFITASRALGSIYEMEGETQKAIEIYEDALVYTPNDKQMRERLANLFLATEKYETAAFHLQALISLDPEDVQTALKAALVLFKIEKFEQAEKLFVQLIQNKDLAKDRIYFYLAALYERQGEFKKSISHFEQVDPNSKYFVDAQLQISRIYDEQLGDSDKSIGQLRTAISLQPESRDLYLSLAGYHERQEQMAEAIRILDQATRKIEKDEELLFILGSFLDKIGDYEAGIQKMELVLEVNPNHAAAMNHIGYVYTTRKIQLKKAEQLLIRAVQIEPQNAFIIDSLGWLYFQKGNFKKAKDLLEKANALNPNQGDILEHLADAYLQLGMKKQALKLYRKVVKVANGDHPKAPETNERIRQKIASVESEHDPL